MSKKTIIIIIVIILLLCSCITISGAVGGYFYYKNKSGKDKSTTEETNDDTDNSSSTEDSDSDSKQDDIDSELLYQNSKYDFTLTLEPGWEDYDVNEVTGSDYAGFVHYYDFSLPSKNQSGYITLFTIMVYTDEQWAGVVASGALDFTGEEKVGESEEYVFTFSHINANPPSDLQERMLDLDTIKDSFELN